jgi:hypothetical protein
MLWAGTVDWNYSCAGITFLLGAALGLQSIYYKFPGDPGRAFRTGPGFLYLLSRGLVPALMFAACYSLHVGPIYQYPISSSLGMGLAAEGFIRSKVFLKDKINPDGTREDLLWGFFDLLQFYQNWILRNVSGALFVRRERFISKHLPALSLEEMRTQILTKMRNWPAEKERDEYVRFFEEASNTLSTEYQKAASSIVDHAGDSERKLERDYKRRLGYLVLDKVGERTFRTLFDGR